MAGKYERATLGNRSVSERGVPAASHPPAPPRHPPGETIPTRISKHRENGEHTGDNPCALNVNIPGHNGRAKESDYVNDVERKQGNTTTFVKRVIRRRTARMVRAVD